MAEGRRLRRARSRHIGPDRWRHGQHRDGRHRRLSVPAQRGLCARPRDHGRRGRHHLHQFLRVRVLEEHLEEDPQDAGRPVGRHHRRHGRAGADNECRGSGRRHGRDRGTALPAPLCRGLGDGCSLVGRAAGEPDEGGEADLGREISAHGNLPRPQGCAGPETGLVPVALC